MKFKRLIEEQNRLECLKTKEELTDYGLEMLAELNRALQLLQTDVSISNYIDESPHTKTFRTKKEDYTDRGFYRK